MSRIPHEEFPVNGTLFRFPSLPPEDSPGRTLMVNWRCTVLAKARQVRGGRPPRYQVGKRVTLLDATMAAPAGTRITVGGHGAEVWCAGPISRSVWALRSCVAAELATHFPSSKITVNSSGFVSLFQIHA